MIAMTEGVFKVLADGGVVKCMPHGKGLHYWDIKEYDKCEAVMVSTVNGNYKGLTKNPIDAAAEGKKATCSDMKHFSERL